MQIIFQPKKINWPASFVIARSILLNETAISYRKSFSVTKFSYAILILFQLRTFPACVLRLLVFSSSALSSLKVEKIRNDIRNNLKCVDS